MTFNLEPERHKDYTNERDKLRAQEFEGKIKSFFTPKVVSTIFFLTSFYFYSQTCYRTLPPGETMDFMLAGHEFGIPHAPGYPLLTIIGTVTSVFPGWLFGMGYVFQMNMVMCAISSLANVLLFYLVKYITGHTSAGIMAMMGFGFSPHVWNLAYTFDSLALNNLLVIGILYSYFHQVEIRSRDDVSSSKNRTICRIIFVLCGIALTNQHQAIFIILPIIIEIWITEITSYRGFPLGEMMIFLCLPLVLYLQMPLSAHMQKTHWKWGHCDSLIGWLRHVFQMDHGVSIFTPANKYPDAKASVVHFSMAIYDFWHLVSRNFGWWSNILFFLGNIRCYFNRKTKMLWLLMIINILIFAKFLHTRQFKATVINRLWIQPTIFYVIFVAIGFAWLIDLWNSKVIEKLNQNETFNRLNGDIGQTGFNTLYYVYCFISVVSYMYAFDRSRFSLLDHHVRSTMQIMPKNAVVFGMDNRLGFSIPFLQLVDHHRMDIDFVHPDLFIHNHWKKNKEKFLKLKFPPKEYGSTMFDRETNITRYQHNVLEFVLANQQRNLFFCQNEDDRQLDFLKKHPRLQFIPWSHCDQVYVQTNYTLHEDVQAGDYFAKRSDAVRKIGGTFWGFAPPHLSLMPQDSYEYWINEIMWKEKTRFSRMAESLANHQIKEKKIQEAMHSLQQAGSILHTEIKLVLSAPLTRDPEAMIPPNWFKQLANIHLKLADYGGQDHFENFKLSRQLMEKFVRYSEIHGNKYDHWQEMRAIKTLDNVIKFNGTLTYTEANSAQHAPPSMNKEMKRTPGGVIHDFEKFKPPPEAHLKHLNSF